MRENPVLLAGLGNPEREYKGTRHNTGFEVINKLAFDHNVSINKAKHRAHTGEGVIAGRRVLLAKPQAFMNLSGECVRDLLRYYSLSAADLVVVYDDCDLPLGEIRVRVRGSAGSHNGVNNIIYHLETDEFARVRVGIGEKPEKWDLADYVLSRFGKDEMEGMIRGVTLAGEAVETILIDGAEAAMNKFNGKAGKNDRGNDD